MSTLPDSMTTSSTRRRFAEVLRSAKGLIGVGDIAETLKISRADASKIASRWVSQGRLERVRRGLYAPVPQDALTAGAALGNPWLVVPEVFGPGYVGGWSAAEHWALTEQIFRRVFVMTSRPVKRALQAVHGAEFFVRHVPDDALFGTRSVWVEKVRVDVSDPHRTIIDMLNEPSVGGGIQHVASCLNAYLALDESSLETLVEYGDRLGNGAIFKRLGFLLSRVLDTDHWALAASRERLTSGYAKLDPALDCPRIITRWRLRVPDSWIREG